MQKPNRMSSLMLPVTGRIDELDTISTPEALKAYQLEAHEGIEGIDPLEGYKLDILMYQPLGLHGTYTVEGIDGPEEGQGYGGAVFTIEVTEAMSMFNIMELVWQVGRG